MTLKTSFGALESIFNCRIQDDLLHGVDYGMFATHLNHRGLTLWFFNPQNRSLP
jgi:hypothetical protein